MMGFERLESGLSKQVTATGDHRVGKLRIRFVWLAATILIGVGLGLRGETQAQLQRGRPVVIANPGPIAVVDSGQAVPRQGYLLAFQPFYQGEYRDALRGFRAAANGGVNTGQGRWVDSICYYTMIGECMYHMGDLPGALAQYEAALELAIARSGWLQRIQLAAAQPNLQVALLPWGPSQRNKNPGIFPQTMLSQQGTDLNRVLREGGTVAPPQLVQIRVVEIMRCLALAIKRRGDILGPIAPTRRLTGEIVRELSRRQVVQNHWLQTLADVQLGLAQAAAGDRNAAYSMLQRSLEIGGQFDHPLTALGLLAMGDLALQEGKYDVAQQNYFEATFPAAYFDQPDVLEEAMRSAAEVHTLKGETAIFAPLLSVTQLARGQRWDRVVAGVLQSACHHAAVTGDLRQASTLLGQARQALGRSDLVRGDLGASLQFLTALVQLSSSNVDAGKSLLTESLAALRPHSTRWLQIELTQQLLSAKEISPRIANDLFTHLLREPTPEDWQQRPDETILYETSPHEDALGRWLEVALEGGQVESILLVSEQLKRHRFFQTQPLGGRLLALRWVLAAPDALLSDAERTQRKLLLADLPKWAEHERRLAELKEELSRLPVAPENPTDSSRYTRVTREIQQIAERQEADLWQVALMPRPATRLFPPLRTLDDVQSGLAPGQAILALVSHGRETHALFLSADRQYKHWQLAGAGRMLATAGAVMRAIGNYDAKQVVPAEQLAKSQWQSGAAELFRPFAEQVSPGTLQGLAELVIVPDGSYWYVPFEMLQVTVGGESKSVIEVVPIRYAPTIGLSLADQRPTRGSGPRVIVHGRLFSRDSDDTIAAAAEKLRNQAPNSTILRRTLPATTQFCASGWRELIVLDDIEWKEQTPLEWSPAQVDANKDGGMLQDWLRLPWGCPDIIALPGFNTLAENGMRGRSRGDEMFLLTCGLMGAGAKNVMLSRWRTGGAMSMEIVREYLEGLRQQPASQAWQRSVQLARSSQLDPASEPRIKNARPDAVPTADHPFFWAGYMIVGN